MVGFAADLAIRAENPGQPDSMCAQYIRGLLGMGITGRAWPAACRVMCSSAWARPACHARHDPFSSEARTDTISRLFLSWFFIFFPFIFRFPLVFYFTVFFFFFSFIHRVCSGFLILFLFFFGLLCFFPNFPFSSIILLFFFLFLCTVFISFHFSTHVYFFQSTVYM